MLVEQAIFDWIQSQEEEMIALLEYWANINSWSDNLIGLANMIKALETSFDKLEGDKQLISLKPRLKIDSKGNPIEESHGKALRIIKRPRAPIKIFLGGHMDTVYSPKEGFQKVERLDKNTIKGPGVADMKGGLVILLKSLEALERSPYAEQIGWEVLINPDEELGSHGSEPLFLESAHRNHLGLLFEPSFPDGSIVTSRKGSANFTVVSKGKAAHAGRDFYSGRNAITALVKFIIEAEKLNDVGRGITVNIGHIEGGGAINIVPDLAICRFNIRMTHPFDLDLLRENLYQITSEANMQTGISLMLYELVSRSPKPFDQKNEILFKMIEESGKSLGIHIRGQPSGGVCDGNILSAAGLPTLDTLGVVGGNIHTSDEYALASSLVERTILVAHFLLNIANGEIDLAPLQGRLV